MDKTAVVECVKKLADLIKQNFPVKKVILFGSYAKGYAREDSDIDVAVLIDQIEGDFLSAEAKLFQLRRKINSRIEPILLETMNDHSGFLEEIMKTGEIIYNADQV